MLVWGRAMNLGKLALTVGAMVGGMLALAYCSVSIQLPKYVAFDPATGERLTQELVSLNDCMKAIEKYPGRVDCREMPVRRQRRNAAIVHDWTEYKTSSGFTAQRLGKVPNDTEGAVHIILDVKRTSDPN